MTAAKGKGLSKSLQAILLATLAMTALALLKPEPADAPWVRDGGALALASNTSEGVSESAHPDAPWVRLPGEEWKPADLKDQAAAAQVAAPAPPPPRAPPAPPPKPTAPDPGLIYLGRIDKDGRSYVFLGRGAEPQVVEIGGMVDAQWKVEQATAERIELRYLPLNESRSISVQ